MSMLALVGIWLTGLVTGAYLTHALHPAWCRGIKPAPEPAGEPCPACCGDGWFEGAFGCFDCWACGGTGRRGGKGR